ncbi:MAG TPA: hypothetical protein DEA08_12200 [Planctomycetes bacterium]|nr:hypothetical protein [Planctomycetota bacterium]
MSRPSKWIAAIALTALLLGGNPAIVHAQDDRLTEIQQQQRAAENEYLAAVESGDDAAKARALEKMQVLQQISDNTIEREGATAQLERIRAQIERDKAYADAAKPPTMLEQLGSQLLQGLLQLLMSAGQQKLNDYLNGPNDELMNQIKDLEEERTRLEEELANGGNLPTDGSIPGLGPIITDPNGNTGYDRDGDGYVDIPTNPDGSLGNYNPSNPISPTDPISGLPGTVVPSPGSDDDALDSDDTLSNPLAGIPGSGGASMGNGGGPSFNFGGNDPNNPNAAAGTPGVGAENPEGEEGAEDGKDESALAGGAGGVSRGDGGALGSGEEGEKTTDEAGRPLEKKSGRIAVLPKLRFEDLAGNQKPTEDWSDSWEDDGWDDSADNGDLDSEWAEDDDWGEEWDTAKAKGAQVEKKTTSAEDKAAAELVDQIIRVETVIADWRKIEVKAKEAGVDPYGFEDGEMGYRASGAAGKDPFKDVRTSEGKIDLSKVDVWLIEEETWKDGEEPKRFRLKVDPEEVTDFDPIHGGVAIIRGVIVDLDVDERVLEEIKGKVKELEVDTVLLSAEKPPADMDSLEGKNGELEKAEDSTKEPTPEAPKTDAPAKKSGGDDLDDWDDEGW